MRTLESSHTPGSEHGCVIFVKLWQFDLADRTDLRIDTTELPYAPVTDRPGVGVKELFIDQREKVSLEHWAAKTQIILNSNHGIEILVTDGSFSENGEVFKAQSWLRLPPGSQANIYAGAQGTSVWIKKHLEPVSAIAPKS